MPNFRFITYSTCFLAVILWISAPFVFAQQEEIDDYEKQLARKEELRSQLQQIQEEIQKYRQDIQGKQKEEKGLTRQVNILTSSIKKTELELSQTALALRATDLSIEANNQKIEEFAQKINQEKKIIAELMRALYEEGSRGIVELIMASGDISDFFKHEEFLESIQASLYLALQNLKQAKGNVEEEQKRLEEERDEQTQLKRLREEQKKSLFYKQDEKRRLLTLTREEKEQFERVLTQKEKDIEQIRNQIFLLESTGISMPLHKAYEIARASSEKTGIRPAFLLAVLKQESSWGANVGLCYLVDSATGMGKGKNTGSPYPRTMKPSRDVQPFLQITKELGRDPLNTLVSCPHADYGYGGAMGPAQFIPSTWMAYRDELAGLLGHTPDPWDIHDSFTASALKLSKNGAAAKTLDAEWKAAMIYYAGSRWNNPVYSFYGDSVMELASAIEEELNILASNN